MPGRDHLAPLAEMWQDPKKTRASRVHSSCFRPPGSSKRCFGRSKATVAAPVILIVGEAAPTTDEQLEHTKYAQGQGICKRRGHQAVSINGHKMA